jgi:Ca-activated chloride channel family protein
MLAELAAFHFLRPLWLALLVPACLLLWRLRLGRSDAERWRHLVAPHLLPHLLVRHGAQSRGPRPLSVVALVWLLAIIALAGPAWQRQPTPFSEDQAALVVAIKVSPEMLARDVQPSRLQRAVHKVRDLVAARPGARVGLVAYAGSAHLAVPLTSDPDVVATFAAALSPDIMPVPGDAAAEAVALGNRVMRRAQVAGSIVLVADAVAPTELPGLRAARDAGGADVHVLAMAAGPEAVPLPGGPPAPPLDERAMADAARAAGGSLRRVSHDDADVRALTRDVVTSLARTPAVDGERWQDAGYWLTPVLALLILPLFRRGGAMRLDD